MAKTSSLSLQDRSRYVRLITELSINKPHSAEYNLAERLGNFVGVSGSMNLARGLKSAQSIPVDGDREMLSPVDADAVRVYFFEAREKLISKIVDSFSTENSEAQTKVPSQATGVREEALQTFDPYYRFFTSLQFEMVVAIKMLRDQVRMNVSRFSPVLQRLIELDRTLDESLEAHTRKQFNIAPKVLEQRFKVLKTNNAGTDESFFLEEFYTEMRELLLAELDLRLQPVVGLLEALNEQEELA